MTHKPTYEDTELHRIASDAKRRYRRIKMLIGIVCKRKEAPDINIYSDDVSPNGIRFYSQNPIDKDEEVTLNLPVGHGKYEPVKARVAWVRKGFTSKIEGGVEFSNIKPEIQKLWEKFIDRNSEK